MRGEGLLQIAKGEGLLQKWSTPKKYETFLMFSLGQQDITYNRIDLWLCLALARLQGACKLGNSLKYKEHDLFYIYKKFVDRGDA